MMHLFRAHSVHLSIGVAVGDGGIATMEVSTVVLNAPSADDAAIAAMRRAPGDFAGAGSVEGVSVSRVYELSAVPVGVVCFQYQPGSEVLFCPNNSKAVN